MLRHFVNSAGGRFLVEAIKLVQRACALSNRIRFLNRLRHISLRQNHGFAKLLP